MIDTTKVIKKVKYGNTEIPLKTLNLENANVTPTTSAQTILPDDAHAGFDQVNVAAVTSDIDNNIQANNIRLGVRILGVEGNLEADKPDQEKTVTPTEQTQEVTGDTGYELAKVTVNPIPSKYKDTTNANVTAGDILAGKVAVNGSGEVTGTIETYNGATTVTPTTSQQTLSTDGKYLEDDIVVEAIQTEEKTPTIDFTGVTEVEVTPTSGKYLTKVTVEKPNALTANNIKSGVTVFGIAGNLEPDKPDQTKTVDPTTSQQIVEPDTGYELASVTVNAIQTEQKTVKSTSTSQTITPTSGKFIDEVTVDPIVLQSKTVTPTTSQQTITPDSGNDGLSSVTVDAIPSNYKDTTNATALAGDILAGKVAVNSTGEISGNIQTYAGSTTITENGTLETAGKYLANDLTINISSSGSEEEVNLAYASQMDLLDAISGKKVSSTYTSAELTAIENLLINMTEGVITNGQI